jgi:hypothetical protein
VDKIIYTSKKITPDQAALLKKPNASSYPASQGATLNNILHKEVKVK